MSSKVVTVLLSGGIDSTSCVHMFKKNGHTVRGLFVDFGQSSAEMERRSIGNISKYYDIDCDKLVVSNSENFGVGELVGRNAFLVFTALMFGRANSGLIAMGIHSGSKYYDCTPQFLNKIDLLVRECTGGAVSVIAPFLDWEKHDIYSFAIDEKVPVELTYSCELGREEACGLCASCKDREYIFC